MIDEKAAVGINMAVEGGLTGSGARPTYFEETCDSRTQEAHADGIRELVSRDENHPSVVL